MPICPGIRAARSHSCKTSSEIQDVAATQTRETHACQLRSQAREFETVLLDGKF